jgi:NTE family protein
MSLDPLHARRPGEARACHAANAAPHRLALVLGSGGVRSVAALGIVERLAREGIRFDLVAGCSSGALFGALVASGLPHAEALRRATALWSAELTQRHRWGAWLQLVAPRLAGFDEGFSLRDDRLIAERLHQAFGERRIEDLATTLRIAATDAVTGAPVTLEQGLLVPALRASIAVPVLFPSVHVGLRRLVDGVVSDPLPLAAAADAQAVVALGFRGSMPRRVDRPSRLVARTGTALINNLMQARLDAACAAGQRIVSIDLALERPVGLWQTDAMPYLYEAGQRAAQLRLAEIEALVGGDAQRAAA